MKFGEFEIGSFVEQPFKLDGGTMFGVIPKQLWSRAIPADDRNLIPMVTNIFVLRAHGKTMLFDIGLGDTLSERECKVYGTDGVSSMDKGLAEHNLKPEDIDYLLLTHLHTDHAAGAVKLQDGEFVPRFPNAKIVVDKREWDVATNPNERTSAVYIPERYHALKNAGVMEFIESDTELFPGIKAVFTGGHTEGHYAIEMESDGQKVYYYADIFPTTAHMGVPWVAATDVYPLQTMEAKRKALPKIVDKDVVLAFDHDIDAPFAKIKQDGKRFVIEPVTDS